MKRLTMIAMLLVLAGCAKLDENGEAKYEPTIYVDRTTGCEYLSTGEKRAMIPRIAADGKTHMGCKAVQS